MKNQRQLTGKTVLITGGSKGIGKATALALARHGVNLILFARTHKDLQQTADEIATNATNATNASPPPTVRIYSGDGSDANTVQALYEKLAAEKITVDTLIHNMGVGKYGAITTFTAQDYDWLMNTNMRSTFLFTKYFVLPMQKRQAGDVIFVASVSALNGLPGRAIYCASKNAQLAFAESLDYECRKNNVRVAVVAPGGVHTDFALGSGRHPDMPQLAKMLKSDDVAAAIEHCLVQTERGRVFLIGMRPLSESLFQ